MSQCGTYYFEVISYIHQCSSELVSGVVSTALSSGTVKCPTDDLQLDTPVRITIEHSDTVKVAHSLLFVSVIVVALGTVGK